jgi:hypothetical protein
VEADLLLCDHAEAVNGKLYINGGGWNALFAPDWNEANIRHELTAELLTDDGAPVQNGDPLRPVRVTAQLEMGRPPGIKPGTDLVAPFVLGFQGLVLDVGGYVWLLKVGEEVLARRPFQVVAPPTMLPGFGAPGISPR